MDNCNYTPIPGTDFDIDNLNTTYVSFHDPKKVMDYFRQNPDLLDNERNIKVWIRAKAALS